MILQVSYNKKLDYSYIILHDVKSIKDTKGNEYIVIKKSKDKQTKKHCLFCEK